MRTNRSMPAVAGQPRTHLPGRPGTPSPGFATRWIAGDHRAQLAVGDAAMVVVTADMGSRSTPHHGTTHGVMVRVEDVDAHHARTQALEERILDSPRTSRTASRSTTSKTLLATTGASGRPISDVVPEDLGTLSNSPPNVRMQSRHKSMAT